MVKPSYSPSNVLTLCGPCFISRKSQTGAKQVTYLIFNNNTQMIFEFTIPNAFDHLRPISALHNQMLCAGIANSQLAILGHRVVLGNERLMGKLVKPNIYFQHSWILLQQWSNMHICRQLAKKQSTIQTNIFILAWFECKRTWQNQQFYHISAAKRCHGHQSNGKLLHQFDLSRWGSHGWRTSRGRHQAFMHLIVQAICGAWLFKRIRRFFFWFAKIRG